MVKSNKVSPESQLQHANPAARSDPKSGRLNSASPRLHRLGLGGSEAWRKRMTKLDSRHEEFCICCNAWGPADTMLALYRFPDPEAGPSLWLHHHCAEACANMQFEAAMNRFASHVHTLGKSQSEEEIAKARAQAHLAEAAKRAATSLTALRRARTAMESRH
jgi:hypothetical protein